jgi:hypothetical protein
MVGAVRAPAAECYCRVLAAATCSITAPQTAALLSAGVPIHVLHRTMHNAASKKCRVHGAVGCRGRGIVQCTAFSLLHGTAQAQVKRGEGGGGSKSKSTKPSPPSPHNTMRTRGCTCMQVKHLHNAHNNGACKCKRQAVPYCHCVAIPAQVLNVKARGTTRVNTAMPHTTFTMRCTHHKVTTAPSPAVNNATR